MILKIFSVFDGKALAYIPPFFLPLTAVAVRTFADLVNDPKHQFSKHAEDYTLFELGEFDDNTGVITPAIAPIVIHNGLHLVQAKSAENQLDLIDKYELLSTEERDRLGIETINGDAT